MRRRQLLIALLGSPAAWPLAARAQQPIIPVIGFLHGGSPDADRVAAFRRGLKETGYVEGQNVAVEYHWADGHYDRLPAMAADLVSRQMAVIAATSTPAAIAAKAATSLAPIVFVTIGDPVQVGLVQSLSRPGGNLTGATYLAVEVGPKLLELFHEVVPRATTAAALVNPTNPNAEMISRMLHAAARDIGLELRILNVGEQRDLDSALGTLIQLQPGGLVIVSDAFINSVSEQLAAFALRHKIPTLFQTRGFASAGGLMSYGGAVSEAYRQAGLYTGRVLKGEKPGDLPVQQTTKVELVINLKTAKALGITVPVTLLGRADEVIE